MQLSYRSRAPLTKNLVVLKVENECWKPGGMVEQKGQENVWESHEGWGPGKLPADNVSETI